MIFDLAAARQLRVWGKHENSKPIYIVGSLHHGADVMVGDHWLQP